jgi:hypothetical protein
MECARDRLESKRLCATINGQILMRRLAARFKSRCQLSLGSSRVPAGQHAHRLEAWERFKASIPSLADPESSLFTSPLQQLSRQARNSMSAHWTSIVHLPSSKAVLLSILSTKTQNKSTRTRARNSISARPRTPAFIKRL